MAENVVINGTTYNGVDALALIRADGTVVTFYPDAVRYNAQTLTEAQKEQARQNIGAQAALTEADKEAIVQQVITALGTPVFGTVDLNNRITLSTEHLAEGTYELGYEDEDGNWVSIGTINKIPAPTYTNVLPLAINSDKTPFVGTNGEKGYKSGYRLSGSGAESAEAGRFVTGFIEVTPGCTVYLEDIGWYLDSVATGKCYVHAYNSSFERNADYFMRDNNTYFADWVAAGDVVVDSNNHMKAFKVNSAIFGSTYTNIKYIRLSAHYIGSDSIITINEPIV